MNPKDAYFASNILETFLPINKSFSSEKYSEILSEILELYK